MVWCITWHSSCFDAAIGCIGGCIDRVWCGVSPGIAHVSMRRYDRSGIVSQSSRRGRPELSRKGILPIRLDWSGRKGKRRCKTMWEVGVGEGV